MAPLQPEGILQGGEAAAGPAAGRDTSQEVLLEQVRLAYTNMPVSQLAALLNAVVLALVVSHAIETRAVIVWLLLLVAITLARMATWVAFRRVSPLAQAATTWHRHLLLGAFGSGLVWGATFLIVYPVDSIVHQVFIAFVAGGMVVGAMVALTPVFSAFVVFSLAALVPAIARYLSHGDQVHLAMAAMGAIFLGAMLALGKRVHDTLRESLELRFENRHLISYLTDHRKELVSANADLLAARDSLTRANEALETRVAERTAALQAADRRKDEFLAVLSHELRNPLAPIRNSIYILNHFDPGSDQARHARDIIERQTNHIARLVDDLLDVTRIARGKIELRRERADLAEMVRRSIQDYASVFEQCGIELTAELPDQPVMVDADATRIEQMVGNLLQNAARFTPAQGRASLSLRVVDDQAEVRVSDSGAGIPPELLPALFEPFMQAKQSLARTEGGLGLGLALVKGIAELHGGSVRAESGGLGKGSTFTVRLPITAPVEQPRAAPGEPAARAQRPRTILVVDDNNDAADTLAQLVTLFGHTAQVAYDGTTALAKARASPPDVMLCDLGLPGITGYDIARTLRAEGNRTRLIAVSGYAQPEDSARALEAGFERHIAKPIDPDTMRELLL
jgi:signal transduction histidine kinase